jgi:hypothetical protein
MASIAEKKLKRLSKFLKMFIIQNPRIIEQNAGIRMWYEGQLESIRRRIARRETGKYYRTRTWDREEWYLQRSVDRMGFSVFEKVQVGKTTVWLSCLLYKNDNGEYVTARGAMEKLRNALDPGDVFTIVNRLSE